MTPTISLSSARLEVGSIKSDVLSHILYAIFRGELPTGTRLKVQHLAARFGVSSTPIREAIVELAGLGVVELSPNRGASVAPFGMNEVREIYHVRKLLEVESARMACHCGDHGEIGAVLEETLALQKGPKDDAWIAACIQNDRRMHQVIAKASGSSRLKMELNRYGPLMHTIRGLVKSVQPFHDQILTEHLKVLQALLSRDEKATIEAMGAHLDKTCERALEGIFNSTCSEPRPNSETQVSNESLLSLS